ncbi:unnamed protein product [Kluyveromyces dobzhanskii CBS 2104]|uniref:WGS project CCBQ000000000 data, contig 00016 n=1 Tax=Kluyveromyces dobzhanskii CBS 2104 TaxID=1427455 RepID=A0A0A8L1Z1_9SACH|nr:unnamed protein product [Kluyveromyces dobzhanskii CBS 2104]
MFSAVRKIISGGDNRNDVKKLVQRYNKDLSLITNKIHDYETKSRGIEEKAKKVRAATTYYYLTLLMCIIAYVYLKYRPASAVLSTIIGLALLICLRIAITRFYMLLSKKYESRLSALRSLHQDKMEELKQKTNFYYTNSLIQRFSSGESGSDDMMLLMDDEVKMKHEQLEKLKLELDQLRKDETPKKQDFEAREKWFDKALGLLAGGDDLKSLQPSMSLISCSQCKKSFGCYSVVGVPFRYVCPNCGFKASTDTERPEALNNSRTDAQDVATGAAVEAAESLDEKKDLGMH